MIAVSGGVDSMALLDMITQLPSVQLVVAHFDHQVRPDSAEDRTLVQSAAQDYGLAFVYEEGGLGAGVSEERARLARYAFLRKVQAEQGAAGIITAHHQGDVIETMLLNLIRGTGRRGLSSLQSSADIIRPLLDYTKNELIRYATERGIAWREDSTNANDAYLRNYLRNHVITKLSSEQYGSLLVISQQARTLNALIDSELPKVLDTIRCDNGDFVRHLFIMLPHNVSQDIMATLLRQNSVKNINKKMISRLVVAIKTARPHTLYDVDAARILEVRKKTFKIMLRYS